MSALSYCVSVASRAGRRVVGLAGDKRGVAALEFALVVPLLLSMYFVTIEVSQGIETNKKLARVASTVADLITQQQTTTDVQLDAIMKVGEAILKPYGRSDLKIVITAIEITDEDAPEVKVAWSRATAGATLPCVSPTSITGLPEKLKIRGTFLVRVQACLYYEPVIAWAASQQNEAGLGVLGKMFDGGVLNMKESYYLRPRMSPTIPCSGC